MAVLFRAVTKLRHRLRQFRRSLQPRIAAAEAALAEQTLSAAELRLFRGMSQRDQRHCLDVTQTLLARHPEAPLLLRKLTLLHDIGKQLVPFHLWERVLVVLWPRPHPLPEADPLRHDWWRPWQMKYRHPEYGARLAAAAGCEAALVECIRLHHHQPPPSETVALFQWADDQN